MVQLKLKTSSETESLQTGAGAGTEGEGKDKNDLARASYIYQGEEMAVQDEKRGKHQGLRDATRQNLPQIVSLPLATGNEIDGGGGGGMKGVRGLNKPLGVRQEFLKEGMKVASVEEKKEEGGDGAEGGKTVEIQVNSLFFIHIRRGRLFLNKKNTNILT